MELPKNFEKMAILKIGEHSCRRGTYNSKYFLQIFLVPECSLGLKLSYETE